MRTRQIGEQAHAIGLHGKRSSQAIENEALACLPVHTLMRRAGASIARLALALAPHAPVCWVVCGGGNNGGDGLASAALLSTAGKRVVVTLLADRDRLGIEAREALASACASGAVFSDLAPKLPPGSVAIDAMLGLGAIGPLKAPMRLMAQAIRSSGALVLSVDLPSGLDCDSGQTMDVHAVKADHTLSLLTLKPGLFFGSGRDHAGQIWWDCLGVSPQDGSSTPEAWLNGSNVVVGRCRSHDSHKGRFADVVVVGGDVGRPAP